MLSTRVCGIPCLVDYSITGKFIPAKINADPDSCYEAEYPEIDFTVCDRRGRPAPWLERKLTDDDREHIESEIIEYQS